MSRKAGQEKLQRHDKTIVLKICGSVSFLIFGFMGHAHMLLFAVFIWKPRKNLHIMFFFQKRSIIQNIEIVRSIKWWQIAKIRLICSTQSPNTNCQLWLGSYLKTKYFWVVFNSDFFLVPMYNLVGYIVKCIDYNKCLK